MTKHTDEIATSEEVQNAVLEAIKTIYSANLSPGEVRSALQLLGEKVRELLNDAQGKSELTT